MATKKITMSNDHKAALAAGRKQSQAVKAYLEALKATKPRRGRKRTTETITSRLAVINNELPEADALQEVLLLQERTNLEAELASMGASVDLSKLEEGFVAVAASYSASKGIDHATWRKVGVQPGVLAKAGIKR